MKNLMDELQSAGLSKDEAGKALEVVYEWIQLHYPVMAAMARTTMLKENPSIARKQADGGDGVET